MEAKQDTHQVKRGESLENNPYVYSQLVFSEVAKIMHQEMDSPVDNIVGKWMQKLYPIALRTTSTHIRHTEVGAKGELSEAQM